MNLYVLLQPTFSNTLVSSGPWLIIVGVVLGAVFLAICIAIYLQRPNAEDVDVRPALTIRVRGPASNLIRNRRPIASEEPRRQPDHSLSIFQSTPVSAVPSRARWEASDTLPSEDRERALEVEADGIAEEEPLALPAPPVAEPTRKPLMLPEPPVFTAAVPNFVFERVQSTTTRGSLAFGLQATTLSPPPPLPRIEAPPPPVIALAEAPQPPLALSAAPAAPTVLEIDPLDAPESADRPDAEQSPEPVGQLTPVVEVCTEPLRPLPPLIPEIRTEALPPAAGEIVEEELLPAAAERTPEPHKPDTIFLSPSPSTPIVEDLPARSTPFERMKRRRAVPTLDKEGRATYITYTFDPDTDNVSNQKPRA